MPRYKVYIDSKKWKKKSREFINSVGYCENCGKTHSLTCHHITYKNLGNETKDDIKVWCWGCHKSWHEKNTYRYNKNVFIFRHDINMTITVPYSQKVRDAKDRVMEYEKNIMLEKNKERVQKKKNKQKQKLKLIEEHIQNTKDYNKTGIYKCDSIMKKQLGITTVTDKKTKTQKQEVIKNKKRESEKTRIRRENRRKIKEYYRTGKI